MEELTYVALRPLTIRGERREAGELVPEAVDWSNVGAYISTGRIAAVPRGSVNAEELEAAEAAYQEAAEATQSAAEPSEEAEADETPDQQESGVEEASESEKEVPESFDYHSLNVDEVVEKVESGELTVDEVLEYELNRPDDKDPRSTLMDRLDSLENGEADEGE